MSDQAYGLSREGIRRTAETNKRVLSRRPDNGRRTRRVYPPGGAGGGVEFTILTADCTNGTATATVSDVPAKNGTGVSIGDTINLWDFNGCNMRCSSASLVGRKGWASEMSKGKLGTPAPPAETPIHKWHIINICCAEFTCN